MRISSCAIFLLAVSLFFSCRKDESGTGNNPGTVSSGKQRFTTLVNGDTREYWVHVPVTYDGKTAVPVVLMLHGTSGDGEKFYTYSGWKEVGNDENIITVFPSSWRYCIIDNGEVKNTTKWNTPPDSEFSFCAGQTPRDDIKFLRTVITEVEQKYNVDARRIYLAGFSNGGQMAAKCAIELSDKLAAVAENAGSFYKDSTYVPKRKLPVLFQIGNQDYGSGNTGPAVPLSLLDTILRTPGLPYLAGRVNRIAGCHIRDFQLQPGYTLSGDTNAVVVATYKPLTTGSGSNFYLSFVKGLGHMYPNGDNHWMEAARVQWAWFKQFSLP